ncbi:MAG: thioesterase [Phycisphaerales bacterium]|nr:thioesterase [Phycisphaerales bacterium]
MSHTTILPLPKTPDHVPDIPGRRVWFASITPSDDAANQTVSHVSNVEYVKWIDAMGQGHLASLGWTTEALIASGAMWFVARHEIDYLKETYAGETLLAATWVRDVKRVKSWRDTIIWRELDNTCEVVCTASTLWVHVDLAERRPVRPPAEMMNALDPCGSDPPWRGRR